MSNRRQEIYDRLRASSKTQMIIDEMIRLGFWKPDAAQSEKGAELEQVTRELNALHTEASRLRNIEGMRKAAHKQRLADAMERRQETKRRRLKLREQKATRWTVLKTREIIYLGEGVSTGLSATEGQPHRRLAAGLPDLPDVRTLAMAMGVKVGQLRWLAFHRKVAQTTHYQRFTIPKKTGGERLISAPMPRLKAAQNWVLHTLLNPVPLHDAAHGFVPGRSIMSNARPHVGKAIVVNMDLQTFFPSVGWLRVRGLFQSLGYSPQIATVLALLCTEADVREIEIDGRRWFVHASERHLPQGSPASPAISNLLCRRLDRRLQGLVNKAGFTYTRYADDLTFSSMDPKADIGRLIGMVRRIVTDEGFTVHPDKTRIMRRGRRMEVTGLVVNDRLGVPRDTIRKFRATLFKIERDGPDGARWGSAAHVFDACLGFAGFVHMVDPAKGTPLLERVHALIAQYGWTRTHQLPTPPKEPTPPPAPVAAPEPEAEPERGASIRRKKDAKPKKARKGKKRGGFSDFKSGEVEYFESDPEPKPSKQTRTEPAEPTRKWWEIWKK
ncbi:MAG: RNA-directed DNA polymerase [Bradymonadia bacterium]|jgi:RNA-directed DNA polymerase